MTLPSPSGKDVSVHYATSDGTATAGSDYVASSGSVSFAPGQTQKTVLITVTGDDATEGDETFDVTLSSPVNATLANATDVVTIVDNDPIPPARPSCRSPGGMFVKGRAARSP
jgi:Calx-beta domain